MLTLLLVVLAAPPASAKSALPTRAAVFIYAKDGNDGAAGKTETRLTKALDDAQVNLADVETLFPASPTDLAAEKLLKDAHEAWDNLDYDLATAKFQEAVDYLTQHPASANPKQLADAHFFVGVLMLTTGGKAQAKKAQDVFARALVHDAELSVDPRTYGNDVKKVFDKAKSDVTARAQGALHVETTPGGADVVVHGNRVGLSPLTDVPTLTVGQHLVTVSRSGYEPGGALVDVTKEGGTASIKLKPAPNFGEVRGVANDLVASGIGAGKVPGGARRLGELMKARFLVVAKVSDGAGALEVWDVETGNQVAGLTLGDDASIGTAVGKVKQFMGNPSPVKSSAVVAEAATPGTEQQASEPVFKKWWFWTAVGAVAVGGATAATVAAVSAQGRPFNVVLGTP